MVVPKQLRDQYNLLPGTDIEIEPAEDGIRLRAHQTGPSLVEKHGVLVHHGGSVTDLNVVEFVRNERTRRSVGLAPEESDT